MGMVKGFVDKFRKGLRKTSSVIFAPIRKIAEVFRNISEDDLDEIEEALFTADVGVEATGKIIDHMRDAYKKGEIKTTDQIIPFLKDDLKKRLVEHE